MERARVFALVVAACGLVAPTGGAEEAAGRAPRQEVSVPSAAFADDTGSEHCRVSRGLYAYYRADAEAVDEDCDLVAAAILPDRARLLSLSCSLYDAEAGNAMEAYLVRVDRTTGALEPVFATPGTIDSGSIQQLSDASPALGTARVDNGRYAYYVTAAFSQTDFTTTGNAMRVYGCSVAVR
jgi:hypothetical protein